MGYGKSPQFCDFFLGLAPLTILAIFGLHLLDQQHNPTGPLKEFEKFFDQDFKEIHVGKQKPTINILKKKNTKTQKTHAQMCLKHKQIKGVTNKISLQKNIKNTTKKVKFRQKDKKTQKHTKHM